MGARDAVLIPVVGILLAVIPADAAPSTYLYEAPVVARTAGLTCHANNGFDNTSLLHSSYVQNWTGTSVNVFCPIIRRNVSPYGVPRSGPLGDTRVDLQTLWVFAKNDSGTPFNCRVYGSKWNPSTSSWTNIMSAPQTAAASGDSTLTFNNPFGTPQQGVGMVNIGFLCTLTIGGGIYGSVARFPTF